MARLPPKCPNGDPCIGRDCEAHPRSCRQGDIARFAEAMAWDDTGSPIWVGRARRPHQCYAMPDGGIRFPELTTHERDHLESVWRASQPSADLSKLLIG